MKTTTLSLRKSATNLFAVRFALLVAIVLLTVSAVNSQTQSNSTVPQKTNVNTNNNQVDQDWLSPGTVHPVNNAASVSNNNSAAFPFKLAEHAPYSNDPDYEAKKEEWINNYPDEYNEYLKKSSANNGWDVNSGIVQTNTSIPQKIAEHAPDPGEPNYEAKKIEWVKNYPEEYKAVLQGAENENPDMNDDKKISSDGLNIGNTSEINKPVKNIQKKVAEHAPYLDDPNYAAKKAEWIQNYPEEYKATLKSSANADPGKSLEIVEPASNFPQKVAEHAPDLNDPDYVTKKTEWIKNYPEEYNALMSKDYINTVLVSGTMDQPAINFPEKLAEHAPLWNAPDYEAKKTEWIKNYPEEYKKVNGKNSGSIVENSAKDSYDLIISTLDYGKGGIFDGRNPKDEVVLNRDMTSKHFRNADGTVDAIITAGMPLNYEENGSWKTIRKEITPNNSGNYTEFVFANTTNTTKTYYSDKSTGGILTNYNGFAIREWVNPGISWMVDGNIAGSISITNSLGNVDLNKIIYGNCFPGTDVRFTQENAAKKMDYILNNTDLLSMAPAGASHLAISETVILPEGWSYRLADGSSANGGSTIYILNYMGVCIYAYAAPEFYDSKGDAGKETGSYVVNQNGNELIINTLIPMDWLTSAERVFPITIDPTTTIYATEGGWQSITDDTYLDNVGFIFTGFYSSKVFRAWAKFNTSTIPDASFIGDVTLALYCDGGGSASATTINTWSIDSYYGPYAGYSVNYYNDMGAGTNYNSYTVSTLNALYGPSLLGVSASARLKSQLVNDQFEVGVTNSNTASDLYWKRFTGSSYIVVTYNSSPACGNTYVGSISPSACYTYTAAYTSGTTPYWSFAATAGRTYHFTLGSNAEDSYLRLYDANMAQVAYNDDYGPFYNGVAASLSWTCATSGTYYITGSAYSCAAFYYSGSMAYWYTDTPYGTGSGNTITPTTVWQNQAYTLGSLYWYTFAATAGTYYDFSLCSNAEDSYLKIYDLNWVQQAYNDNNGPFCAGGAASISWGPSTTGTYIIAIYNYGCDPLTNSGNLAYRYATCNTQPNDICANATQISDYNTPSHITDVLGCTDDCAGIGYFDVFYSFTPEVTGSYTIDMGLSYGDTYMRIFSGSCCGTLVASDDDSFGGGSMDPKITLTLTGGTTYWFECGSYYSSGYENSAFNLNVVRNCTAPANETCAAATNITFLQISNGYNTSGTLGCADNCTGVPYHDVFYRYDCLCTGSYSFDMRNSDGDTYMKIFSGSCCGTLVASGDDEYGGMDPLVTVTLTAGTTYWIECGSYSSNDYMLGSAFNFYASSTCVIPIGCGNTYLGTLNFSNCYPQDINYAVGTIPYWSFNAVAGTTYNFSLGGSTEDTYLHLYNSAFAEVAANDDSGPFYAGLPSSLSYTCTTSGTYFITACHYVCNVTNTAGYLTYWSSGDPYGSASLPTITPTTSWQNQAYAAGNMYVYRFPTTAGYTYDFSLCSNAEDSYIRIYNTTYDLQFSNDDNGPWCTGVPASGSWTAPTTGYYIIQISHFTCTGLTNAGNLAYKYQSVCTIPANPTATGTAAITCGNNTYISATSLNSTLIYWYTGGCGTTLYGTSLPGLSLSVSPTSTTTYYARAYNAAVGGCWSVGCGSVTITVNPIAAPTPVTASPAQICGVGSSQLNATSAGNTIYWYTVPTGGSYIGSSASGINFAVSPATSTTYYAEANTPGGGGSGTITTTFAGGNAQDGNMFDVNILQNITISSFDVNLPTGTTADIIVYYKTGTHVGFEATSAAWTQIGSASGIVSNGVGVATPLNLNMNLTLLAGQTYAFYITTTNGVTLQYTNGTTLGNIYVANSQIQVKEGIGIEYPYGATYSPRIWNGIVRYTIGSGCISARTPVTVSVSATPSAPAPVTASPPTICAGDASQLNATSTGNSINWYTVSTGGTPIGASASGSNYSVSPATTTTYYAEAYTSGGSSGSQTFSYTGTIENFTVPAGITSITITAIGATGGKASSWTPAGGKGARMVGTFNVTPGDILNVLVGGAGGDGIVATTFGSGGGGGGSFVTTNTNTPLIIAGGGGGVACSDNTFVPIGADAVTTTSGVNGNSALGNTPANYGVGGVGGYGATQAGGGACAGNGGGLLGNGAANASCCTTTWAYGFVNGGAGGAACHSTSGLGGFGGGGGGGHTGGGGGGGYSGGGASWDEPTNGGGGGSYNAGTDQINTAGYNASGNGSVLISWVANTGCVSTTRTPVTVTVTPIPSAPTGVTANPTTICTGGTSQLNATSAGNTINWYTVATGGTAIGSSASGANYSVTPATTTTYYAEAYTSIGSSGSQTFSYTGTIENFTVPAGITSLTITAIGATGGKASSWTPAGGKGARMVGTFSVTPGDILNVLVGGAGADGIVATTFGSGGGGGGTFVTTSTNTPLIVAGGGGGVACHDNTFVPIGADAVTTTSGVNGNSALGNTPANYGVGGVGGYGATQAGGGACAGNGGGLLGNGAANASCCTTTWAYGFVNGGAGGAACHSTSGLGGFGGGGGGGHTGGGGGGGYSGGGASWDEPTNGGGGGSYNAGTSQTNTAGYNASGNGSVLITWAANVGCSSVTRTPLVVTVVPDPTVGAASASPTTICISGSGTLTATVSNGTGMTYQWQYATASAGPYTNVVSGTPAGATYSGATSLSLTVSGITASGTYWYRLLATSSVSGCSSPVAGTGGSLVVNPNNTITLSAGGTQTKCINTAITTTNYGTTGATGATVSGLPTGVTGSWAAGVVTISGTPTVSGTFTYTVTLTGGCGTVTSNGTITVTPNNTVSIASSTPTLCINSALTAITHTTTGATGIGTATGLPAGVTAAWASNTITISGTPTVSGTFNYTIPLTGGCGAANATGIITIIPNNTASVASSTPTLCISTALTAITHTTTGAIGIGTATGLPAGVTAAWASNTITISGTPTVSGTFNYTIPLTGGCGAANANGTITVMPNNTITLAAGGTQTKCVNTAITTTNYGTTGATGATVTGLPTGVTGSWAAGVVTISGTPTVSGTFTYTVTLTGGCGTVTANGTITVIPDNTITLISGGTQTKCINTAITMTSYGTTGATGATVTGLPAGVTGSWAAGIVTISGTPTVSGVFTYTVTLTGGCGTLTNTGTITVTPDNTITLAAGGTQTKCINTAITTTNYGTTGATGATVTGLPTGVTGNWAAGVVTISGTPTVSGAFTYTVTLTGGCGAVTALGTITVTPDNTITLTAGGTQANCINTAITTTTYATTGATGATITGLPTGVTGAWASNVVTINGTPTATGTYTYTVTLTGGCGAVTSTGTITVNSGFPVSVSIQPFDNPTCSHTLVSFTSTPVNGGSTPAYQWYVNGALITGATNSTYSSNALNNGDYIHCQMTSNLGCTSNNPALSDTVTMVVSQIPIAEAGNTAVYTGTPVQIGDINNGPGTISWSPAAGLNNTWIAQPLASPSVTTTYTLTVDNYGCVRTDTVTVYFGGLGHVIIGKTRYLKKATAGNPAPNLPSYNAVIYNIDNVEVKLKTSPGGVLVATTVSNASGVYQFANVPDGNYMLSYDHIPYDTMQYVNSVNAVDLALLKYYIGHICLTDPSRCFSDKHTKAANADNNASVNAVDIARISAKIGLPYDPARNFPKGNWVAFDTLVTVAGADLNVTLQTVAYGDYDASSTRYKDSTTNWSLAKVLPDENIIIRSDESIMMTDPKYFEVPLRISTKMNELAAVGLELRYPNNKYKLVSASMSNTGKKGGAIKINPTLEEIIAANNDLLVTDGQGIIRVVYATTDHFDIAANVELVRLGFLALSDPGRGELDFDLNGTGLIANQYGEINSDAYLTMPKIFVQGNNTEAGFEFAGYPNPFSSDATLTYIIPESGTVKLNVYNAIGELVSELVNETQISGRHEVVFSQKNLSAGMYTFKLEFSGLNESKYLLLKMIH